MISDYRKDYEPYLYVPEVPEISWKQMENSPTRLIIVTGKLDTQTPHDLAQQEFDRLPMREKFIFTADHAGHGIINSWEVPGFTLELLLSFMTTGSQDDLENITNRIDEHNNQPDRIWKAFNGNLFKGGDGYNFDFWNFKKEDRRYSWWGFGTLLIGSLLPPIITFIIIYKQETNFKLINK